MNALVFVLLKLSLNGSKVHGVLHDIGVVRDVQRDIVHGVGEDVSSLVSLHGSQYALSCLLPLIKDWSAFWHFWNLEIIQRGLVLIFVCNFKVFGNLGILPLKVFEFSISHWRVIAVLAK